VLPLQRDQIFCVAPTYRPGIDRATLDFPGGRLPEGKSPQDTVPFLLARELGVPREAIACVEALNSEKWIINSAFSNQGLWAFAAQIDDSFDIPAENIGATATADTAGLDQLMQTLDCLQCRAVLHEWRHQKGRAC